MNKPILKQVMSLDEEALNRAVLEELYDVFIWDKVPAQGEGGNVFIVSYSEENLRLCPMYTNLSTRSWQGAVQCLEQIRLIAAHDKDGDLLMDHVSGHLTEMIDAWDDMHCDGSPVFFYTPLFNHMTIITLVQACLAGIRSWRLDPEDW